MPPTPPRRRTHRTAVAVAALLLLAAGSVVTLPGHAEAAPARYRERVFDEVTVTSDLEYGRAVNGDGAEVVLVLDLYEPTGDTLTDRPAIVWAHGGGFGGGNKTDDQAAELARHFAHLGYVTASISYRLKPDGGCSGAGGVSPDCIAAAERAIADGQAAVRWLRANADTHGIDPTRIGFGGISAGAIIATGVGLTADTPAPGSTPGPSSAVSAFASVSGGLPPGPFATADDAPGILFGGTADDIVPYAWSRDTAAALTDVGVAADLVTFEGAGHVPWGDHGAEMTAAMVDFFFPLLADAPPVVPSTSAPPTSVPATDPTPRPTPGGTTTAVPAGGSVAPAAVPVPGAATYTG